MDDRQCFYNIVHPGFLNHKPKIPQAFIRHITSGKATMKCSSGRRWPIKLLRIRDSVVLADGWKEYAIAHSLREKDLLLFTCDKNMCFEVRIYDPNGLERVKDGCWIRPVNLDHHSSAFWQDMREVKDIFVVNVESEDDNLQPYEKTRSQKGKQTKKDVMKEAVSSSGKGGNSRTPESFRSKFPFFVKHLKEYNVDKHFVLGVPTGFAKKHLPSEKTMLTLWNLEGKKWKVILNHSANQTSLGGGWKSYASDNNLRQGQCCVFELVDDLELLVHTFSS